MPHRSQGTRNAAGGGSLRKKIVKKDGKEYLYWEARYTAGYDPRTGKQVQRSITGKTQKEVVQKLRQVTAEIDQRAYQEPCKLTVGQWLDIWAQDYLTNLKPRTLNSYQSAIRNHLKPAFENIKLEDLPPHMVQRYFNSLQQTGKGKKPLAPKSIHNLHGVLHKAMQQAVELGYLRRNPAALCKLPRMTRAEIKPLDDEAIRRFLTAIKGHPFEAIYLVTIFTGMRQGEVLGLSWDSIDFEKGTVYIRQQLQRNRSTGQYELITPKHDKCRLITPASTVMATLREQSRRQAAWRLAVGEAWENTGLVFTDPLGHNLSSQTVYLHFKKLVEKAGCPKARFHDLRHSYAVAALQSGDDVKTLQENLGHHSAAFTLDVYCHVTEKMRKDSADRMEQFIQDVSSS